MDASRVKVLPEAAQLEMVRAAATLAAEERGDAGAVVRLTQVAWHGPVVVGPGQQVHVDLHPGASGGADDWAVFADAGESTGSTGTVTVLPDAAPEHVDVDAYGAGRPGSLRVDLGEPGAASGGRGNAVVVPGQLAACLAAVAREAGWGEGEVWLLGADEVTYADASRQAVWGAVDITTGPTEREATLSVDLVDRRGTSLVRFRGLRVSADDQQVEAAPTDSAPTGAEQRTTETVREVAAGPGRRAEMAGWSVAQCLEWELGDVVFHLLKLPLDKLDGSANLQDYGFDSISLVEFAGVLAERLGIELTPDVFFSHPTLDGLAGHLLEAHAELLAAHYQEARTVTRTVPTAAARTAAPRSAPSATPRADRGQPEPRRRRLRMSAPATPTDPAAESAEPVAIVGMSGRFPGARSVEELWEILADGRSVVGEVPADRRPAWGTERRLGAIPGVAEFDPLFFEISPREAELMDPRQRLLLQEMWKALEDAGYGPEQLGREKVGVFVGVEEGDYRDLLAGGIGVTSNSNAILASRLAYFLNLSGPSMAINTACSSGLVALHEACLSLRYGDCDTAIVAGVNVLADPASYDAMAQAGMLSPEGVCRAFDRRADGMVPGEAVAVLVLRKRPAAEADGQRIYATVLGSGVNYDGKTNGITAPSGAAQVRLLRDVHERAGVAADSVEYLVTHGTGTRLGDPIEINALAEAFRGGSERTGFCALTSTKPNIGHTQAASGLVSVMALAWSMKREVIPPSIHCEELSDYIRWEDSPFFVNRAPRPWPQEGDRPRRGGVSAFGMSGTNAHVVLEAHGSARAEQATIDGQPAATAFLLPLSAKTAEALSRALGELADHLEARPEVGAGYLASVSHTLMAGRHHFAHRCAVVVQDREDAVRLLRQAAQGDKPRKVYRGTVTRDFTPNSLVGDLVAEAPRSRQDHGRYQELLLAMADLYCQGYDPRLQDLFDQPPARISLPTYPFARQECWVPDGPVAGAAAKRLHPLVHENTSSLTEQRYTSLFTGAEPFLTDHVVQDRRILPAAAYLEMAREAVQQATRGADADAVRMRLVNLRWLRPLAVDATPVTGELALIPEPNGDIGFEIFSGDDDGDIHCQGDAVLVPPAQAEPAPVIDVPALRASCTRTLSGAECYDLFATAELRYGPTHRTITELGLGTDLVVARLALPEPDDTYVLHPGLLDGAFQATAGFMAVEGTTAHLPVALDEAEIYAPADTPAWAVVRRLPSAGSWVTRYDIDLCDEAGQVCARLRGFTTSLSSRDMPDQASAAPATGVWEATWTTRPRAATDTGTPLTWAQRHLLLCDPNPAPAPNAFGTGVSVRTLTATGDDAAQRFTALAERLFTEVREILAGRPAQDVLLQVVVPQGADAHVYGGLSGLLKTAHLENPRLSTQLIALPGPYDAPANLARIDAEAAGPRLDPEVRYTDERRLVPEWRPLPEVTDATAERPWRADGGYLITGGAGGLGLVFAEEIARSAPGATITLTGRSAPGARVDAALARLTEQGATASYRRLDVTDPAAVAATIADLTSGGRGLHGVLHCAGVLRDDYLIRKELADVREVLAPKVTGLVALDAATAGLDLDFLVCFGSTSGSVGNPGQADYALGNAFMDHFAVHRAEQVRAGLRSGRTLTIDWALWQDGGMGVDDQVVAQLEARSGLVPMPREAGIAAFYRALRGEAAQVLALTARDQRRLATVIDRLTARSAPAGGERREQATGPAPDGSRVVAYLTDVVTRELKLDAGTIDPEAPLSEYGIDSISVMALTDVLEGDFGKLPKTLFFEYQTLAELGQYLLDSHPDTVARLAGATTPAATAHAATTRAAAPAAEPAAGDRPRAVARRRGRSRFLPAGAGTAADAAATTPPGSPDIAIIGLAGRYPQAPDLDTFWDNLRDGRDSVTEVPADRWDHQAHEQQGIYCRWGGFLDGVDQFDPLFFGIAPREAELMDPQERLFLQATYAAIQDAGYTPRDLDGTEGPDGADGVRRAGVFVGVMTSDYQFFGLERQLAGTPIATGGNFASMANRVSYHLNFHGPSLAVDTMCSSSLTAISLACESIRRGESDVALAGGVNLSLHPNKFLLLSQGKFASSNGRCESFGDEGDGYVPAEGVGAVLLKPLERAVRDGDHVYGVIRGTALNHGGRTNGYTVPNPGAQGNVIGAALRQAGIDPRAVSYVEAHGTGTKLGDPIEIRGLSQAFDGVVEPGACAIGSVKSNIGHAEAAAGIAGLTKVLLQMRHGTLVPSLHSDVLNPFIDFDDTPFAVQRTVAEWRPPVVEIDGVAREFPRIAGLSSFGAGGSNAHLVIEEYRPSAGAPTRGEPTEPVALVLSAKTEERLRVSAERLRAALRGGRYADADLPAIAHTLQVGREAMPHRLGFLAQDLATADRKLAAYLEGSGAAEDVVTGQARPGGTESGTAVGGDGQTPLESLVASWVTGLDVDWRGLHGAAGRAPGRISLPTYPFAEETYWLPGGDRQPTRAGGGVARLHPLVHENTSDLTRQRFTSQLPTAPTPAAQLEMARAALLLASPGVERDTHAVRLTDVTWHGALAPAGDALTVHLSLLPTSGGSIEWTVYADQGEAPDEELVAGEGRARIVAAGTASETDTVERLDRDALDRPVIELPAPAGADGAALALVHALEACLPAGAEAHAAREVVFAPTTAPTPAWALVDHGTDELDATVCAADGTVLLRVRGLTYGTDTAEEQVPETAERSAVVAEAVEVAAGPGRRAEMAGWSVAQCLEWELKDVISLVLKVPADRLEDGVNLQDYGFDSISLVEFAGVLGERLGVDLTPDVFFSYPTLEALSGHLLAGYADAMEALYREGGSTAGTAVAKRPASTATQPVRAARGARRRAKTGRVLRRGAGSTAESAEPVAIVGMSGRFPGARSVEELWEILADGRSVVGEVPADRRPAWGTERRLGAIPGVAEFDPLFFEISPREAENMDPRQRLLLQEMWKALEDAGYGPEQLGREKVGVFVGVEEGDYVFLTGEDGSVTAHATSILAARLAYFLNLSGPSLAINTSCSSGLVALHEACLSLRYGDCDTAIVAGANILSYPGTYDVMAQAGMLSPEGVCRAFDRRADGMVPGEAVAVLVLRKRPAAEADGQRIYATVLGSGVNYDGKTNGITAPSGAAQVRLLRDVHERAGVAADSVEYLVTHGTGTRLGDPIEINALAEAFRGGAERTGFCALTSTKPNIGHTQAASGLVSVMALAWSMKREVIPPSIHCEELSDYIRWEDSPFFVNRAPRPWPEQPDGTPRRGGVSAFGFSGTNAHVVLEAHGTARTDQAALDGQPAGSSYLLPVSAKTPEALTELLGELADHLEARPEVGAGYLASVSHTLMAGRHHFAHRCAVVVQDREDAVRLLRQAAQGDKPRKVYRGTVTRDFTPNSLVGDLVAEAPRSRQDHGRYQELLLAMADFYCQGYDLSFDGLFDQAPIRISLPHHPFARELYWPSDESLARRALAQAVAATDGGDAPEEVDEYEEVVEEVEEPATADADAVPAGPGRRAEMIGWSVAQCLEWELGDAVSQLLKLPLDKLDGSANLQDYGFDSISLVEFAGVLAERLGIELTPDVFFSYPTLDGLAGHLMETHTETLEAFYREGRSGGAAVVKRAVTRKVKRRRAVSGRVVLQGAGAGLPGDTGPEPVAIVGMSGRFPGARTVDELWEILTEGRSVVGPVPADRPGWGTERRLGAIPGVAEFDPLFFEISPREAENMDPRQRLLLQEMWKALEDAGYGPERLNREKVGVFVGVEEADYVFLTGEEGSVTSNATSILASRLAYFLNLSGPSLAINTSCSSGLVALHEACLSLRYGDCDTAIVAGANILAFPGTYDAMARAGMLSEEGVCRAFDRRADGMVPGEAVAVLVLRKQPAAEADGQRIYATVLGSGVNYDGKTNGITAPSGAAQARLLREAYERTQVSPDSVEYLVTHGTGTRLGDPIEINALAEAFRGETERTGFCALTSTKPNIGHTQAASGLVSVMALAWSMKREVIPPSIHCEELSDYIRWEDSPFFVNRAPRPWPERPDGTPRRGGVSAFGFSGTNAHVILEAHGTAREDEAAVEAQPTAPAYLLPLSAKTAEALAQALTDLADHLAARPEAGLGYLASVSHTLTTGRHHFAHRCAVVVHDRDDAVRLLRQAAQGDKPRKVYRGAVPREFAPNAAVTTVVQDMTDEAANSHHDPARYQELLLALADFYCQGYDPRLQDLFDQRPAHISLPTHPFAARHLWVGGHRARMAAESAAAPAASLESATPATPAAPAARPAQRPAPEPTPAASPRPVASAPRPAPAPQPAASPRPVVPGVLPVLAQEVADAGQGGAVRLRPVAEMAADMARTAQPAPARPQRVTLRPLTQAAPAPAPTPVPAPAPAPVAPPRVEPVPAPVTTPAPEPATATPPAPAADVAEGLVDALRASLARELFVEVDEIDADRSFTELGLDSVVGVEWVRAVNQEFGTSVSTTKIYQYPNVAAFADFLAGELATSTPSATAQPPRAARSQPVSTPAAVPSPPPAPAPATTPEPVAAPVPSGRTADGLVDALRVSLARELFVEVDEIDAGRNFTELGLDSVVGVEWVRAVNQEFGSSVSTTKIYQYPTLKEFADFLAGELSVAAPAVEQRPASASARAERPDSVARPVADPVPAGATIDGLVDALRVSLARELFVEVDEIDAGRNFTELGLDSVVGVEWVRAVNQEFDTSVSTTKIYQYPNLREFAEFLAGELPAPADDDLDEVLAKVYEGEIDIWQAEARLSAQAKES
ncbi:SDR family NAD(P)-dependent oxidoreductase [Streptomyces buecherae]|uniref:SDR family NAD(P)-dependent oxidoreductase n=1 Tax=Streptomyces buecherae TaxID=2763006 RepID=UPI0033DB8B81